MNTANNNTFPSPSFVEVTIIVIYIPISACGECLQTLLKPKTITRQLLSLLLSKMRNHILHQRICALTLVLL